MLIHSSNLHARRIGNDKPDSTDAFIPETMAYNIAVIEVMIKKL